jgi:hypothetical protein
VSWPVSNPKRSEQLQKNAVKDVLQLTGTNSQELENKSEKTKYWLQLTRQATNTITGKNRDTKLRRLNGNFAMFRGILTVNVLLLAVGWASDKHDFASIYIFLGIIFFSSLWRFHLFGKEYAIELFTSIAALNAEGIASQVKDGN